MNLDKAWITNTLALMLVLAGYVSPYYGEQLRIMGFFALSGALTNWLAIHMLFEKVPLLYGSGVIPARFEAFKTTIKALVMEQFFEADTVQRFIREEEDSFADWLQPSRVIDAVDYDAMFQKLVDAIMASSFGGMLGMLGGADALNKLREPFIEKIRESLAEMVERDSFKQTLAASVDSERLAADLRDRIEAMVDQRLSELTPQRVKEIVQSLIREHLGWLVVWGGVFGGLIGLGVSFL